MPLLVPPVIPAGWLADVPQPTLPVDGELLMRPWGPADAPAVFAAYQDPAIQQWHSRRADSEAEARTWIAQWRRQWTDGNSAQWAVVDTADGRLLGRMSLRAIDLYAGQAEATYWTTPAARGRGVAPRALAALVRWSFEETGFNRLELAHSVRNEPSCRVAEKSGFVLEGVRRRALPHADGRHDMHLHARVSDAA